VLIHLLPDSARSGPPPHHPTSPSGLASNAGCCDKAVPNSCACTSGHTTCNHACTPAGPARAAAGRRWRAARRVQAPAAGAARAAPHHLPDGRVHGRAGPRRAGEDRFCRCVCGRCTLPARRVSGGACAAANQPLHQRRSGQAEQPGGRGRCRPGALALPGSPRASCCNCTLYVRTAELLLVARAARYKEACRPWSAGRRPRQVGPDTGARLGPRRGRRGRRAGAVAGRLPRAARRRILAARPRVGGPVRARSAQAARAHAATALRPALTRVGRVQGRGRAGHLSGHHPAARGGHRLQAPLLGAAGPAHTVGSAAPLSARPCGGARGSVVASQAACVPRTPARQAALWAGGPWTRPRPAAPRLRRIC